MPRFYLRVLIFTCMASIAACSSEPPPPSADPKAAHPDEILKRQKRNLDQVEKVREKQLQELDSMEETPAKESSEGDNQ